MYRGYEQAFAEVEVLPSLGNEIFTVLLGQNDAGGVTLKVNVNPLVNWIWIGGVIFCLAPFLILRYRRREAAE